VGPVSVRPDWLPPEGDAEKQEPWSEPLPIGSELPPVASFDASMMPASLCSLVEDVAERMQVPPDYPAACGVLCLGGAVNRRARIQPKENDTSWIVTPNLWGAIVAPPGFLKSPVLHSMTLPLQQIEALWRAEYESELQEYELQKERQDLYHAAWRESLKAAIKSRQPEPIRPDFSIREPTMRRFLTSDATFEKMHELMRDNPAGIFVIRDELTGWLAQLDRQGREGERAFALQAWNGETGHTIDRIGRGSVYVPACCMSIMGGITPGRLRSYLADALEDGPSNDGLIQRFQVLVWPDTPRNWEYVDRPPRADQEARALFHRLASLDPEAQAIRRFTPEAQEFFVAWLASLEYRVRGDNLPAAMISHLSKYRKLMPALALLFFLADQASGMTMSDGDRVSLEHAQKSASWCTYLGSHANRMYSCVTTARMRAAADLAAHLKRKEIGADGILAKRDVYRHHWTGLDTPEAADAALEVLEEAGWVRPISRSQGITGRPPHLWQVNPRIWEASLES
jgi:putative DNA primase/helicase